ncbi:MAG: flavin reductase (DIM6/NTAB) family NADH-FMN oxidoreductase RutF [Patiriisocius sp.]|jgi:flavin reductase (DIM6/NTAB) family NADH-FMN oxidoreductase RutF
MLTFEPKELPIPKLHQYLLNSIAPRPIALASTLNDDGSDNLAPFSFFNLFSVNPPIAIFSPARRGRNNTTKHTYDNLKERPEVVINIVSYDMAQQCSLAGVDFAKGVSEFDKGGFTPVKSEMVGPSRVKESPVQLECKVIEIKELGTEGGAGNLIIAEIIKVHINENVLNDEQMIDPDKINLVGRMGGANWCKASGDSVFQIHNPPTKIGIGIDSLPIEVRNSTILSGNDLGKLGQFTELPDETIINDYKLMELSEMFLEYEDDSITLEEHLHIRAKNMISEGNVREALMTVLTFNN